MSRLTLPRKSSCHFLLEPAPMTMKFSKTFLAYMNAWMVFLLIQFFIKSLAQKLKSEIAPNAIYVHCFAHCNELIVKDGIKES